MGTTSPVALMMTSPTPASLPGARHPIQWPSPLVQTLPALCLASARRPLLIPREHPWALPHTPGPSLGPQWRRHSDSRTWWESEAEAKPDPGPVAAPLGSSNPTYKVEPSVQTTGHCLWQGRAVSNPSIPQARRWCALMAFCVLCPGQGAEQACSPPSTPTRVHTRD